MRFQVPVVSPPKPTPWFCPNPPHGLGANKHLVVSKPLLGFGRSVGDAPRKCRRHFELQSATLGRAVGDTWPALGASGGSTFHAESMPILCAEGEPKRRSKKIKGKRGGGWIAWRATLRRSRCGRSGFQPLWFQLDWAKRQDAASTFGEANAAEGQSNCVLIKVIIDVFDY